MRPIWQILLAVPLIALVAGCYRGTVTVVESSPATPVIVDVEEDDASLVVYREYYGCSDDEIAYIPHYRRYYHVDDCDLFFLFTVARHTHRPIDVVIRSYYYDCGRDYDRLVVTWRVDRAIFFVALPGSYTPVGPYDRPYRLYRQRGDVVVQFTNVEFRALVSLKIGVEYQGAPPEQFISRVSRNTAAPHKVILSSRETLGQGGRNVKGEKISVRAPRPWTMPEKERQVFHQERQQKAVRSESSFQEKHPERVKEIRKADGRSDQRPKEPKEATEPREPQDPKEAKDPKAPRDPKEAKDPKAPEDPKEAKDPKELERQKEVERQKEHSKDHPKDPK